MYQILAEWSHVDYPKYDEIATGNLWRHATDERQSAIGVGTLVHWAKEFKPEHHERWNKK